LTQSDVVRRFYAAFDAEDLDAFVATPHPHVELQTARGLRIGREEARSWATRTPEGHLRQSSVIEELREHHNHVVALIRKQWRWDESEELAADEAVAALFTFDDGLISRWQPFSDRDEALSAAGIDPASQ
jgi:ketosteroid isomerase-like protein